MLIPQILLLAALALVFRLLARPPRLAPVRGWLIFGASVLALYWLQPAMPIRYLDYWLPTATLALTALGWLLTAPEEARRDRANLAAGAALAGLALLAGLSRYLGAGDWLLSTRPPAIPQALSGVALISLPLAGLWWGLRRGAARPALAGAAIIFLVALLVALKTPELALLAARGLRGLSGQNTALATGLDIRWLGFSYVCFRLIHTLRDRQLARGGRPAGPQPPATLREYTSYVIFFPSVVAGPIDRLERFLPDLRGGGSEDDLVEAARRLALGLFKKFALADTLALAALSPQNAPQVRETGWLWLIVYAYALVIYLDFSGYTDIAVGLGRILGVRLPENFAAPYLKPNLTQFWNSWHMTLTQWFRGYYFNPLVRRLRSSRWKDSPAAVLLFTQASTFVLIGLWHGVTWNFVIWGLWHGLGLFIQNRWSDFIRPRMAAVGEGPRRWLGALSWLLTFNYVALGWVWFTLPTPQMAAQVLARLVGLGM